MAWKDIFDRLDRSKKNPENAVDSGERALLALWQHLETDMQRLDIQLQSGEEIPLEQLQEKRVALAAIFDTVAQADTRFHARQDQIDTMALKGVGLAALPTIGAVTALSQAPEDKAMLGTAAALGLPAVIIAGYTYAAKLLRELDNRIQTKKEAARITENMDALH